MNPFCLQVVTVQVNGLNRSSVKVMTCHACQTVSCYSCDVLQHFGETCAEFQHRLRNDAGHAANQAARQQAS